MSEAATTTGTLLGGRVKYQQFVDGHRSGFEPVLLAAAIQAQPGDRVLEAGSGAGEALLCLGHRIAGLTGYGLEWHASLVELANKNFKDNGLDNFLAICGDAARPVFSQKFDHILANPPWFTAAGSPSPNPARALAHHAAPGLLAGWIKGLAPCLKRGGSFTLIIPATGFSEAAGHLRAQNFGSLHLFPLWPRAGLPAKQIILRGIQGGKDSDKILPGLILHDAAGITQAAEAILREAAALTV